MPMFMLLLPAATVVTMAILSIVFVAMYHTYNVYELLI